MKLDPLGIQELVRETKCIRVNNKLENGLIYVY